MLFQCQEILKKWVECVKCGKISDLWEAACQQQEDGEDYVLQKVYCLKDTNITSAIECPVNLPLQKTLNGVVWFLVSKQILQEPAPAPVENAFSHMMKATKSKKQKI